MKSKVRTLSLPFYQSWLSPSDSRDSYSIGVTAVKTFHWMPAMNVKVFALPSQRRWKSAE
jgi:hypothetical protein